MQSSLLRIQFSLGVCSNCRMQAYLILVAPESRGSGYAAPNGRVPTDQFAGGHRPVLCGLSSRVPAEDGSRTRFGTSVRSATAVSVRTARRLCDGRKDIKTADGLVEKHLGAVAGAGSR